MNNKLNFSERLRKCFSNYPRTDSNGNCVVYACFFNVRSFGITNIYNCICDTLPHCRALCLDDCRKAHGNSYIELVKEIYIKGRDKDTETFKKFDELYYSDKFEKEWEKLYSNDHQYC